MYAIVLAAHKEKWGLTLAGGLVSLFLGGVVLSHPGIALGIVVLLVAVWAMVAGVVSLVSALEAPHESGRGWVRAAGALQVIAGILILAYPFSSTYALMVVIGVYALVVGGYLIVVALYALSRRGRIKLA